MFWVFVEIAVLAAAWSLVIALLVSRHLFGHPD